MYEATNCDGWPLSDSVTYYGSRFACKLLAQNLGTQRQLKVVGETLQERANDSST